MDMTATSETVLDVKDLKVEIDVPAGTLHAVSGIDFSVDRGKTLCLVGESGCGKTMAALAVMSLLPRRARIAADRISLEGDNLLTIGNRAFANLRGDRLSMIFQDPMTSLNPVYTIGDQLAEVFIRHGKGNGKQARERARYLLERVGIMAPDMRLGQFPHELSGGLRQRMMIAMALMCEPSLIIADEPTTALDVTVQAQILSLLANLQKEFHMALILITHDLGVVSRIADHVAVMYAGRIVETGTAEDVFAKPVHPYTRGLLDCIPDTGHVKPGERLGTIPGIVPSLIGDMDGCLFRNRCTYAENRCNEGPIDLRPVSPGHDYRCMLEIDALTAVPADKSAAGEKVAQ